MHSVPITIHVVNSNSAQARCDKDVIKFASDLLQIVGFLHQKNDRHDITEIPKHAGPMDKSGKNQFGPEKYWFPPDRLSGIKYWVCCIKEPCLISNLSIIYFV